MMHDNFTSEATMQELLEPFGEADLALLGRVFKKAADENMSARDLLRLYLAIDQGHNEQGAATCHDTDGYKGLAEAFND
jgi:hypothetical protein